MSFTFVMLWSSQTVYVACRANGRPLSWCLSKFPKLITLANSPNLKKLFRPLEGFKTMFACASKLPWGVEICVFSFVVPEECMNSFYVALTAEMTRKNDFASKTIFPSRIFDFSSKYESLSLPWRSKEYILSFIMCALTRVRTKKTICSKNKHAPKKRFHKIQRCCSKNCTKSKILTFSNIPKLPK